MRTILGLILVAAFAYLGSSLFRLKRLPPSIRALVSSGMGFFAVGVGLGPQAIDLLSAGVLARLDPLIGIGLGWVGLFFGLQFHLGDLRRLPGRHYLAALAEAIVTGLVCGLGIWLALAHLGPVAAPGLMFIGVLALTASTSSPTAMALVYQDLSPRGPVTSLLRLINSFDAVPAVLALGVLVCLAPIHPARFGAVLDVMFWLGVSIGLGLVLGALFHLLTLYRYSETQLLVIVLGLVVFCGGAAHYLILSSLFVNFLVGVVVANRSPQWQHILRVMNGLEKPIYLILLTLAGAIWAPPGAAGWLLVAAFVGLRLIGKLLGGLVASPVAGVAFAAPFGLGPGLLDHGGLALVLALSLGQWVSGPAFDVVLTAVLASMLVTTLIGPFALKRILLRIREAA